jgi:uncharacterized phage protein (TIGR01671 family)
MKKEIRFRAWVKRKLSNMEHPSTSSSGLSMHKVLEIDFKKGKVVVEDYGYYENFIDGVPESYKKIECPESEYYLDDVILLQYTGVKDRQGKEIYEDDIILLENHLYEKGYPEKIKCIVKFEQGAFILCSNKLTDSYTTFIDAGVEDGMIDGEIIGNIYETPEKL